MYHHHHHGISRDGVSPALSSRISSHLNIMASTAWCCQERSPWLFLQELRAPEGAVTFAQTPSENPAQSLRLQWGIFRNLPAATSLRSNSGDASNKVHARAALAGGTIHTYEWHSPRRNTLGMYLRGCSPRAIGPIFLWFLHLALARFSRVRCDGCPAPGRPRTRSGLPNSRTGGGHVPAR